MSYEAIGGEYSSEGLLGCDAVWCSGRVPTFPQQHRPPKRWYPTTTL